MQTYVDAAMSTPGIGKFLGLRLISIDIIFIVDDLG
jgi:hypothetical protein